ncbi:RDD family protein [Salinicoccus sp. HZC-1]|uniref:RDD family protein n=1 Tax=Salinicoccus sp. HZC-1 TaxID=3385497 RepID=UPI00398BAEF4
MQKLAGFWVRLAARIIDYLLVVGVVYAILSLFRLDTQSSAVQASELITMIIYYVAVPVLWFGYTMGKRLFGIRIIRDDGEKLNFKDMFIREFFAALIYGASLGLVAIISSFMVIMRKDKKAIHDIIVKTSVTYGKPEDE